MHDGIYGFCITSKGKATKGVALVESDVIRGLNSSHIYVAKRSARCGKAVWRLKECAYATVAPGVSMRGYEAILDGRAGQDRFALEGAWDGDINARIAIEGRKLCDLQ